MDIRKLVPLVIFILFITSKANSQVNNLFFNIEGWGGYTSNGTVPFWLRSNQFGSIPIDGPSVSFIGTARKDYELNKEKIFDWGASFEGRVNLGECSNITLIEGYGKLPGNRLHQSAHID